MSEQSKEKFDHWFKILITVAIAISGWFFNRMAEKFDSMEDSVQNLEIKVSSMETGLDDLKENFKDFKNETDR